MANKMSKNIRFLLYFCLLFGLAENSWRCSSSNQHPTGLWKHREMTLWSGNCCVHHIVDGDMIINAAQKYPEADILIHPESICSSDDRVLAMPNAYFYSTAGMVKHAKESDKKQFVIATEAGTIHKLQQDNPDKQFILIDDRLICSEMKKVTLEGVVKALEEERYQVVLDEDMRTAAIKSIDAMLSL